MKHITLAFYLLFEKDSIQLSCPKNMDDAEPTVNELRAALTSQTGNIYDFDGVQGYLASDDLYKHIGTRFLCWMIRLKHIPPARSQWVKKLLLLCKLYHSTCSDYFPTNSQTPLSLLPFQLANSITQDIPRTIKWFFNFAEQIEINNRMLDDVELRIQRVLAIISLESRELTYTQGNDRLVMMSYLVSLFFASRGRLNKGFAEAMCYNIAKSLISKITLARYLNSMSFIENYFEQLDVMIAQEDPEKWDVLAESENTSIHFALKWHLTLFCDNHDAYQLMLLWDQILLRWGDFDEFIKCLTVAHIIQVPIPEKHEEMAQNIQQFKDWNISRIITDAEGMMNPEDDIGCLESIWTTIKNFLRLD